MKVCPACQLRNSDNASTCTSCGFNFGGAPSFQQTKLATENIEAFSPGDLIAGRYEVVRELGRGGMGMVFLVKDTRLQNRQVALKMIHSRLVEHPEARKRFEQEVSVCLELLHPNIVRVHNLEEWQGLQFFTMEYIPGRSLRELIVERTSQKQPLSLSEAVAVVNPVLDALSYAHQHTIHRDIKPENILVSGDLSHPTVKVLDFGIAKTLSASRFTQTAQALGTAYYMAPEQMTGGVVDSRADLFSVGMVLYELLTGEMAVGRFGLPSEVSADLPAEVDRLVEKVLSPKAEQRFSSAKDVKAAIEGALSVQAEYLKKRRAEEEQRKRGEEVQRLIKEGEQAYESRRWEQAAGTYQKLLELEPQDHPARERVAEAQAKQKQLKRLEAELGEAAGDLPGSLSVLERLLPLSAEPMVLEEKKAALQRQLEEQQRLKVEEDARQRQTRLKALLEEAKAALKEKCWKDAAKALLQFLVYEPEHGEAKRLLEEVQRRLQVLAALDEALSKGDATGSRQLYEEAQKLQIGETGLQERRQQLEKIEEEDLRRKQQEAKSLFSKAYQVFETREWVKAAQLFRQAIELDPNIAQAKELEDEAVSKEEERKRLEKDLRSLESAGDLQGKLSVLDNLLAVSANQRELREQRERIVREIAQCQREEQERKKQAEEERRKEEERLKAEAAARKRRRLSAIAAVSCVVLLVVGGIFFYSQKADKPVTARVEVPAPISPPVVIPVKPEPPSKPLEAQPPPVTKPAEQPPKPVEQVPAKGRLVIEAEPAQAKIRIINIKPSYQKGMELEEGRYNVELSHTGYKTINEWIEIKNGAENRFSYKLQKAVGHLYLSIQPEGARVEIIGIGRPYQAGMELPEGQYQIRFSYPDYDPLEERVNLKADQDSRLSVQLKKRIVSGAISVMSNPANAQVSIDGQSVGKTPGKFEPYQAGKHYLEVTLDGYKDWIKQVEIQAGKSTDVFASLEPKAIELNENIVRDLVLEYYHNKGEWANIFTMERVEKIRIVQTKSDTYDAHVRYYFKPVPNNRLRRSDSGYDQRIFTIILRDNKYSVIKMAGNMSARF